MCDVVVEVVVGVRASGEINGMARRKQVLCCNSQPPQNERKIANATCKTRQPKHQKDLKLKLPFFLSSTIGLQWIARVAEKRISLRVVVIVESNPRAFAVTNTRFLAADRDRDPAHTIGD